MAKKSACMDVQFCNSCNSGYLKAVKQTIAFSKGGFYKLALLPTIMNRFS